MTYHNHPSVLSGQDDERIQQMIDDQLAKPPSESELRRVRREVSQLHPGNRFRLMAGLSMLPEEDSMPKQLECQLSLMWRPVSEEPTQRCGWYAAAINPVNADELDVASINSWREQFGFTKVWFNKPSKSSPGEWWEPDPHGKDSRPIGHRMTHWAELPSVPALFEKPLKSEKPA